ncbi:DUF2877 domain-containing protein [Enterococcus mundtii]|uniref:DUF2877 domain-containing protein n=1 Tax=Enterococcus mundtii TaxID=53346 RepID=A0A848MSS2_ENTMU|nr:DUF2877 domain-containing protein [Enterococcus mundtii]NMP57894.1 DUF2877 domain-containing protein [Enterococcus mundtii]
MSNQEIQMSEYLSPLLQFGKIGVIHSVFEHSFNVEIKQQLINIACFHDYLSSFGINLPEDRFNTLASALQTGNRVKISDDVLTIYSISSVRQVTLKPCRLVPLNVFTLGLSKKQLLLLKPFLAEKNWQTKIGLPVDKRASTLFARMAQPNREWTTTEWQEVVGYLLGRGKGLTPSGDDLLMGYQLVLETVSDPRGIALAVALGEAQTATTAISQAYLTCATKGYANSLVYQLFSDLAQNQEEKIEEQLEKIMRIGHSSGKDLAFGIWLALQAIEGEESEGETWKRVNKNKQ